CLPSAPYRPAYARRQPAAGERASCPERPLGRYGPGRAASRQRLLDATLVVRAYAVSDALAAVVPEAEGSVQQRCARSDGAVLAGRAGQCTRVSDLRCTWRP